MCTTGVYKKHLALEGGRTILNKFALKDNKNYLRYKYNYIQCVVKTAPVNVFFTVRATILDERKYMSGKVLKL